MQATVSRFDEVTGSGAVLLDDGRELRFERSALDGTGLRLLRPGQRVRLTTHEDGERPVVTALQILTLRQGS